MNRNRLYDIYARMERIIAPKLKYSQYLYEETLQAALQPGAVWLDLGCGHHVLPLWRGQEEESLVRKAGKVVGLDYDWPSLQKHRSIRNRVRGDISLLPFPDETFNLVTANMVVEHLEKPAIQFREVLRVLKPGGVFIFHTPNALGYTTVAARMVPGFLKGGLIRILDGRPSEDVFKTHYMANRGPQIEQLAREVGFSIAKIRFIVSSAKFAVIAPLAFFELFLIRALMTNPLERARTNLIVSLAKPAAPNPIDS